MCSPRLARREVDSVAASNTVRCLWRVPGCHHAFPRVQPAMPSPSAQGDRKAVWLPGYFPETRCRTLPKRAGTCRVPSVRSPEHDRLEGASPQVSRGVRPVGRVGLEPTTEGL